MEYISGYIKHTNIDRDVERGIHIRNYIYKMMYIYIISDMG